VLPNGPVGQHGRLQSGDELLEVNGRKLLGLYHADVVSILKELPMHVRLVCARPVDTTTTNTTTTVSSVSSSAGGITSGDHQASQPKTPGQGKDLVI
jgi:hypothetical protein